jgi:hypothetical protein
VILHYAANLIATPNALLAEMEGVIRKDIKRITVRQKPTFMFFMVFLSILLGWNSSLFQNLFQHLARVPHIIQNHSMRRGNRQRMTVLPHRLKHTSAYSLRFSAQFDCSTARGTEE